jgi:NAD(P)-dependent dehydrogenase (short-subunit alcohol dehydrogenase family)
LLCTGAASGIGAGIAKAFVAEGAFLEITDLQDVLGAALAKSLAASASSSHLDLRLESDWISVIDSILKDRGKLDILVNNAGITGL